MVMGDLRRKCGVSLLLLAAGVTLLHNAPIVRSAPHSSQQTSCSAPICRPTEDASKLKYEEGKTYTYAFETEVVTKLVGTTDEQSSIKLRGTALLAAKSPCEFVLTVQRAAIQGPTRQVTDGVRALEGSSIQFSYQDGAVEGVCISETDPSWSANIKRALVSMLQNRAVQAVGDATVMEIDISGRCPTTYTLSGSRYTKTRALNSCTYRDGGFWVLQGVPYYVASEHNSGPLVNSSLSCVQDVSSGIINSVVCEEVHRLTPLASGEAGGQSVIKSSLTLSSTTVGLSTGRSVVPNTPSSLFYDHSKQDSTAEASQKAIRSTEDLLKTLCDSVKTGTVSSVVPGLAQSLRKTLRSITSLNDLVTIYAKLDNGQLCQASGILNKIFLDSAAKAGSSETISFLADLISKEKVDESTQQVFRDYTSFAAKPNSAALSTFTRLISSASADLKLLLTASALARRYCQESNPDCAANADYEALIRRIAQVAADNCLSTQESSTRQAVIALQALGNLDSLTDPAVAAISKCLGGGSERIKIRALDAFRRDPCQPTLKKSALETFQDKERTGTSEVRIHAYLASIRCIQQDDVEGLHRVLDSEESNQVGSFVASHIRNALGSSSPAKRQSRNALNQLRITKSFPNDPRRFSSNFELSKFNAEQNMGASAEASLIYSRDSYIPRTSAVNLTVDIFGRSYSLLEIGLYLEDFEHLAEKYFGPSKSPKEEITKTVQSRFNTFKNDLQSRFRRDISPVVNFNDIDYTHRQVTAGKNGFGTNGLGDVYIRHLGTTVASTSFSQNELQDNVLSRKFFSAFDKVVAGAKDHNVELTEPITFLDNDVVIPTISGLPLNLELEGTTVLSVQLKGKLDLSTLLKRNGNTEVKSRVQPSAATQIRAKMSVGAGPVESGIQLDGKIHTSSGIDLSILRQDGKFELKVNLPDEKVQVVDIRSELFWVESDGPVLKETPLISKLAAPRRSDRNRCSVSSVLGLRVCSELTYPTSTDSAPAFPLSGNAVLGLSVEKVDASMEGYYFKVDTSAQSDTQKTISVVFDTPGSKVNRRLTGEGRFVGGVSPRLEFDVDLPNNKLQMRYQQWNEDLLKGLEMKISSRSGGEYSVVSKVGMTKVGTTGMVYEPQVSYSTPAVTVSVLEGKVTREFGNSLDVDLRIGETQGRIAGSVKITRQDERNADFSLSSIQLESGPLGKLLLDGTITLKDQISAINLNARYGTEAQHDLKITGEHSSPNPKATKFEASISSSRREFLNFDVQYNSARSARGFENTLVVHRGSDAATRLTFSQSSKYNLESTKAFDIKNLVEVTYPKHGINFYLQADAKNDKEQNGVFELRSGSDVSTLIKYSATGDDLSTYDLNGSIKYPGQKIAFSENAKKLSAGKWKYTTSVSSEPEGQAPFKFDADTDLTLKYDSTKKYDAQSELVSRISSSLFTAPYVLKSSVLSQKEQYQASLKLSQDSGDVLNFATDYRRALGNKPSRFSSKAFVSKYLDASLQETHDRASSTFKLDAKWLPTGRQILATSDLKRSGETYNLDADLKWDASRDASQAASLKSTTLASSRGGFVLDSKNNFVVQGASRGFNVNAKMGTDYLNGENSADIRFRSTDGKDYGLLLINVNESKDKVKASKVGVKVSLPEQEPFEIELTNRASNMDLNKYVFEFATEFKVNYHGNKNVNLQTELSSLLTNKRTVSGMFDASGTGISQPLRLDFNTEVSKGHGKIAASARRGSKSGDVQFDIDFDNWSPKKILEVKYKVASPYAALRSAEGSAKYGYIYTSWNNFEVSENIHFVLNNGQPSSWDNGVSYLNNELLVKYNVVSNGVSVLNFNANGKILPKKITVKVLNSLRGADSALTLGIQRVNPYKIGISITSPYKSYEKLEVTLQHKSTKVGTGYTYNTDLKAQDSKDRFGASSKVDLSDAKKSIDVTLVLPDVPTHKLALSVAGLNTNQYTVDTMAIWGDDGKFISTKGNLVRSANGVEGDLTLDSPALKADKWNVRISKKTATTGRSTAEFHLRSAVEEQASVVLEYAKKAEGSVSVYDGSVAVTAFKSEFGGVFRLDDKLFEQTRDGEAGRELKASVKLTNEKYPFKVEVVGKRTTAENLLSASFCNNEGDQDCKVGTLTHKTFDSASEKGFEVSAITKTISEGKDLRDGVVVKTLIQGNNFFEHSVRILNSEEEEQVQELGYKVYRNTGISQPKSGIEIYLPNRELGLFYTRKNTEVTESLVEAWLDKLRKPEDKLTLSFVYDKNDEYTVLLKHPSLKKDLKITTRTKINEAGYIADISANLDIFKTQPLNLLFKLKKTPVTGSDQAFLHSLDFAVKGAPGVAFSAHSDVTVGAGELITKSRFEYLNREQRQRNYEIVLDYGFAHRTVEVIGPEGRMLMYASRYNHHAIPGSSKYDGYDVRRELFLPGMKDTRIFQNTVSTTFPPSAHIKMYTATSAPGQFYEAWIGFRTDKNFAAGLYGHEGNDQNILADLNVALNNSRLLFVKADWNAQNIKIFLEKAETRLTDTAVRYKTMSTASSEYLRKEIEYVRGNIAKSLPNLSPLTKSYQLEWTELREDIKSAPIVDKLGHYIEFLLTLIGSDTEEVQKQLEQLIIAFSDAGESLAEFIGSLPDKLNRGIGHLPALFDAVQKGVSISLDALVETFRLAVRGITSVFDRIAKSNPGVADKMEFLSDTSKGVGEFLYSALQETMEKLSVVWETVQSGTKRFLESETVQGYIKDFGRKYEKLVTDMIEEYKREAEALRDSILKALPDQEVQEFLQSVLEYVEKRSSGTSSPDDNAAAQKEIYNKFVKAIKKVQSNLFTVDLKNGLFVAQLPLPTPVRSLTDIDQVFSLPAAPSSGFKHTSYTYGIQEVYNKLKSSGDIRQFLPPFKAAGYLIGSQYYRTFDGRFYHFEGKCQYLLASDFVDKNFTIAVDYNSDESRSEVQKSLIVTDQENTISIQPDHSVFVNGRSSSVPTQIGNLEVVRDGDWIVIRGINKGFSASCSATQDVCAVELNGFYLGKTRGLLGTFNNEHYDDLHSTTGTIVETPGRMTSEWKLEKRCQESQVPTHSKPSDATVLLKCANAFTGRASSLRPCFGVVDPSEYQLICESLSQEKGYDVERAVCTSGRGYQAACAYYSVDIEPSSTCSAAA